MRSIRTHGRVLRGSWREFVLFEILVKALTAAIFAPISAWLFGALIRTSGNASVSNYDLVAFFLSPPGLATIVAFATISFALLFFELGGLIILWSGALSGRRVSVLRMLQMLGTRLPRFLELGLRQFVVVGVVLGVAIGVVAVTKATLLSGGDIYFYVTQQPAEFWLAFAIAGIAMGLALVIIAALLIRWLFALPMMLFERTPPAQSLTESSRVVRGLGLRPLGTRIGIWFVSLIAVSVGIGIFQELVRVAMMWLAGDNVTLVLAFAGLLGLTAVLLGLLVSFWGGVTLALLVARLYRSHRGEAGPSDDLVSGSVDEPYGVQLRRRTVLVAGLVVVIVLSGATVYSLTSEIDLGHTVDVTAHRGSSFAAPENTMPALLQAIDDGADVAEIDVQGTADGVVVLFHDTDLRRMAGDPRPVWEVTYDDFRGLDIGSWFSPEFADTRITTLAEAIAAAKGRMKLNIEMKFNGHDHNLESEVIRLVREHAFEDECVITSLDLRGVQEVGRRAPDLRRGLILTAGIGNATDLDVDVLAVNASSVTRRMIDRARRSQIEVHVWTVNEPSQMLTMIHLGVDNIMTDSPEVLVELQRARQEMGSTEKTLLYVSDFLRGRL